MRADRHPAGLTMKDGTMTKRPRGRRAAGARLAAAALWVGCLFGAAAQAAPPVGRLVLEVGRDGIPADGQTPVPVTVRVLDANGRPVAGEVRVTLEHSGGRLMLAGAASDEAGPRPSDVDPAEPGVQVVVRDGELRLVLLAPPAAQDVRLRLRVADLSAEGEVHFVPELRDMVAVGLLEGVVSLRDPVQIEPVRRGDPFEREINRWSREFNSGRANVGARAALFLKGVVSGEYLLTASYDSDKDTRARLLRDIQPDRYYPVYGDSALRGVDARSAERLYLRVDHQRSYLLIGDFSTGEGFTQVHGGGNSAPWRQRSLGAYNRSATGVKHHLQGDGYFSNVHVFNDTLRQVVEEFRSQGSGPYGLSNNAVLEGSEKLEVVVRDRNQPARILSVRPLLRLIDYSFEPFSGRILLNSFLPAFDDQLNPVSLRVSYELDQGGNAFWVTAADGQLALGQGVEVGGSVVRDRNPYAPYELASANLGWHLGPRTDAVLEVARSRSEINTNPINTATTPALANLSGPIDGQAWRAELRHEGEVVEARAALGRSEIGFLNPAAPLQGGRSEGQGRVTAKLGGGFKAYGEVLRSENLAPAEGGQRAAEGVGLRYAAAADDGALAGLGIDFGLRQIRETAGQVSATTLAGTSPFGSTAGLSGSLGSGAAGGATGFGNQLIDPATGLPVIQPGSTSAGQTAIGSSTVPAGTQLDSRTARLALGYRVSERLGLGAEVEQSISGETRQRRALGADYRLGESAQLYGRYERQTGVSSLEGLTAPDRQADAWVAGVRSSAWSGGQLYSELRMRDAISGADLQMASGMRQNWPIAAGVRLGAGVERIAVLQGPASDATAVFTGLDYAADPLWKGSTRVEWRRSGDRGDTVADDGFTTTLWQLMAARKLDRDWTLLVRNYLLRTDYVARGDVLQDRAQIGVAYRETDADRLSALARYELKNERDASNAAVGELHSLAHIVSSHADWHPSRPWWWTGRLAAKWQEDRFEGGVTDRYQAQLLGLRTVYDWTENWDIGAMATMQFGQGSASGRQQALGLEAGRLLMQNLWLSVGWNVSGFAGDADLAGYEYTQRGAYVRLRFKFDEDLFAGGNPQVNRALDRPVSSPSLP